MAKDKDKKQDVKEEPTKAEQVKQELSDEVLDGLSGGFKPHQWPDNPTQVPKSEVSEEALAGLSGGRKGEEMEEEEILTPTILPDPGCPNS